MLVSLMTRLTRCAMCQTDVHASAVTKVVAITGSPQHVALLYTCAKCGNKSKVVSEIDEWEQVKHENAHRKSSSRVFKIELDAIGSAQDLINLWASYKTPPIREEVMNTCGCKECKERLYGKGKT